MADHGRAQARSRGRARAKVATPSTSVAQAAAAPRPQPPQQAPPQQAYDRPASQPPQPHGRAMVRGPAPGPTRRQDAGDATAAVTSKMQSMDVKDEPAQMGRGAMRGRREIAPALRTRPASATVKTGTYGDPVVLKCNYFPLLTQTDWCLYQYRVDFDPDEERTGIRKKLLAIHKDKFGGYLFDGSTMWTTYLLRSDPMEMFSKRESDDQNIRIIIKKTVDLSVGDPAYIQLFNIITRKCLEFLDLQLVGRDYFNPSAKIKIPEYKMELWPGYSTSIRQHENSILMNVEITHKVMRQETVLDIYRECLDRDKRNSRDIFANAIIGTTVLTDYNQKTYRIDDINFEMTPLDTFDMKGTKTSYVDYYKQRYDQRITDFNQPMLVSRTKARERRAGMAETIILIPEFCRATGLTDEMRNNVHLMRALADHTRISPSLRCDKLRHFLKRLKQSEQVLQECTLWNMKLGNDLLDVSGRTLPPEFIVYGNQNKAQYDPIKADWTGSLRNQRMIYTSNLTIWAIITPKKLMRDAQSFAVTLAKASSSLQFNIPSPKIHDTYDDKVGSYCEAIDKVLGQLNPQLIMCIVPNNRADRYSAIKKKACVDRCVPTQVVLAKNISAQSRGLFSIATKIGIQINCKLGGAPWSVEIPINGVMVVGFDTTHDTACKSRSFGATVCSLNKSLTQYYSCVSPHESGEELSNQISVHIANGCLKYKECNQELPSRIIIYRDGVGEGQLHHVYHHEVQEIRDKLVKLYGNVEPKITVIVVSKRINTRIFFKGENPLPGTIVDDTITSPDRYDFFIVSQSVRQGTVSPTSYNVIYDTSGLPPDRMQRFTYKLTHLYFNWSGTVRVPAPCQYAHKLAMLVGQALHTRPQSQLSDRLYFL